MITVFGGGTSRSLRVTWLLEEMGIPYHIRFVDLLSSEADVEFLAANPGGFIPVLQDGNVTMVESIAIMEYIMTRYGPTPLCPAVDSPIYPAYQQFLHLGEAGLAGSIYFVGGALHFAPESERHNWTARQALEQYESRLRLVTRQLAASPYVGGDTFTAADISVIYGLDLAKRFGGVALGEVEQAYFERVTGREAYKVALEKSKATVVRR